MANNPLDSLMQLLGGNTSPQVTLKGKVSKVQAPFDNDINYYADVFGYDPAYLASIIEQESRFNPMATSSAGAKGLTQLIPNTARSLGVTDPYNPKQNIAGGAKYVSDLHKRFGGDWTKIVAAFNAGPTAVSKYGGVPPYPETQHYVNNVLMNAHKL